MRRFVAWLAAVVAVCTYAVTSPLGTDPENYVFAPFDDAINSSDRGGTNGVKVLLQGYVMGPNATYRVIRAEDVAYMAEAIAERAAYLNGWNQPRTYTNHLGQVRKTVYDSSNKYLQLIGYTEPYGPSLSVYPGGSFSTSSELQLPSGYFASDPFQGGLTSYFRGYYGSGSDLDYYKKVHWYYYTNYFETVTITEYHPTRETNTERDDWPDIQNDEGRTYESSKWKRSPAVLASLEESFWPTHSLAEKVCNGIPVNSYLKAVVQALWPEKALEQVDWDNGDAFIPNYNNEQWWTIGFRTRPRPDWRMVRGLYRAFAACQCLVNVVGHDSYTNVIVRYEYPATDDQSVRWNTGSGLYETYDSSQPARGSSEYTNQWVGASFSGSASRSLNEYGEGQWLESYSASCNPKTVTGGRKLLGFPFSGWMLKPRAKRPEVIDRSSVDVVLVGEFSISDQTYVYYHSSTNPPPSGVYTNMYFAYRTSAKVERKSKLSSGGAEGEDSEDDEGDADTTAFEDATDLVLCFDMDDLDLPGLAAQLCSAAGAPFIDSGWDHSKAPGPSRRYSTYRSYSWSISFIDPTTPGAIPLHRMVTFPKFGTVIPYSGGVTD